MPRDNKEQRVAFATRDQWKETGMSDLRLNEAVTRPTNCPFCQSRAVDTLAKIITITTFWRCRHCDGTWTIASRQPTPARIRH